MDGEYAAVYGRDKNSVSLVFDIALFQSAVDYNNTKLWCDTQLAKYLRGTFLAALARKTKATDCGLLREEDLWGANAKPFFKHGKNRICFDKDEDISVWYWLATPANASAANFLSCGRLWPRLLRRRGRCEPFCSSPLYNLNLTISGACPRLD